MQAHRQQGLRNREARRARIDSVNEHLRQLREQRARGEHPFERDPSTGRCALCGRQARSHEE